MERVLKFNYEKKTYNLEPYLRELTDTCGLYVTGLRGKNIRHTYQEYNMANRCK
jgi:hypothetical protein